MTRCITPVLLVTGILGCGRAPSDAPGVVDDDIIDAFGLATGTAGDEEGLDIDFSDDRALTTGTTAGDDAGAIDDFRLATDAGPDEAELLVDLAAPSDAHPL